MASMPLEIYSSYALLEPSPLRAVLATNVLPSAEPQRTATRAAHVVRCRQKCCALSDADRLQMWKERPSLERKERGEVEKSNVGRALPLDA